MGNLLDSIQSSDVIQGVDAGGQAAVETEDLVVDQGGQRKVVEKVGKVLPNVGVSVLSEAFVVEAVNLGNLSGLVVASENGYALGVSNLEGDEKGDSFDGVVASIDVVA